MRKIYFLMVMFFASLSVLGQTTVINFDNAANWTAGSAAITSYASNHQYNESNWRFTGGPALRNGTGAQDGVAGALGTYSWRLQDNTGVIWTSTYQTTGTITAFGFDIRRWDASPSPNFSIEYSINGGSTFNTTGVTINNTYLDNSSNWKTFTYSLPSAVSVGANEFVVKVQALGTTERIMIDNFSFTLGISSSPDIALSSPNPAVTSGNIAQGSSNNPIYRFDLAVTTANATLNGVTINTSGTYAAADLDNLKCWYSADNSFSAGSDVLLSTKTTSLGAGAHVFPGFTNQVINNGSTGYIFITADMDCAATLGNTISVDPITTADISFASGNKSGSAFAGGAQTVIAGTVNNATGAAATNGNAQSSISWTNPTGCYDEVMIVAADGAVNSGTPTGDGTAYTASLVFGSGTALGNGFVVYKGAASPQVVTALTNGNTYYFKIFSRLGTTWSSGVEVSATPVAASSATDYFRSAATGNWNQASSWESSADGNNWIAATLTPTSAANTITIRNGTTITISASGLSIDQVVIEAGGQLTIPSGITFTLANGSGTDLDCFGTFLNSGGAHIWSGTISLQSGGTYIHNTTSSSTNVYTIMTISPNSTWIYRGSSTLSVSNTLSNRTYSNLRFESTSGNLTISPTIGAGNSCSVNDLFIGSNVTLNCASVNQTAVFNIAGNLTNDGTIDNSVGYFNANLTGASKTISGGVMPEFDALTISNTASYSLLRNINLTYTTSSLLVQSGGSLNADAFIISGPGSVTINGTLSTANTNGIGSTGTLAISGTKILGGSSTIQFNSPNAQTFTGRSDYANVIISGGSTKTLDANAVLSGTLTMQAAGNIELGTNNLTVNNISGASASSYIKTNGTGTLTIRNISNTPVLFPIGNSTYNPVAINDANTLDWSARVEDGINPGGSPFAPDQSVLRSWNITPSAAAAGATVMFYYNDGDALQVGSNYSAVSNVQVFHYNGTIWTTTNSAQVPTGSPLGDRTAKITNWTDFSPFAITNTTESPLPVTLLSFSGYKDGNRNQLSWTTASELNNRGFEVQRSTDGINYTAIGFVNSLANGGNSNDQISYRFTDNTPAGVKQYYRLRQEDIDGRSKLSNIVLINGAKPTVIAIRSLFPNPVSATASVIVDAPSAAKLTVLVTDMAGRNMVQQIVNVSEGSNTVALNIASLQSGTYLVRVMSETGEVVSGKLVKQ